MIVVFTDIDFRRLCIYEDRSDYAISETM